MPTRRENHESTNDLESNKTFSPTRDLLPRSMPSSSSFHLRVPDPKSSPTGPVLENSVTLPKGIFPFLHPTHAHIHFDTKLLDWNSRDHRKGRHPLEHGQRRRIRTILRIEWWNISWWVAVVCSCLSRDI